MEIKEIGRTKNKKGDPEKVKEMMDKMRKEHSKMVKGKFEFVDAQGGSLQFNYRIFPEDLLATYTFHHDEICEIPMGLVKHLNNSYKKVRSFGIDQGAERGKEVPVSGKLPSSYTKISRIRFTPVDVL